MFISELDEPASIREANLDARERELEVREQQIGILKQRIRAERSQLVTSKTNLKVGRNERCPCGSGLKYKHCHGLAGRRT